MPKLPNKYFYPIVGLLLLVFLVLAVILLYKPQTPSTDKTSKNTPTVKAPIPEEKDISLNMSCGSSGTSTLTVGRSTKYQMEASVQYSTNESFSNASITKINSGENSTDIKVGSLNPGTKLFVRIGYVKDGQVAWGDKSSLIIC